MCEKIRILRGADRVRHRPAVIFGSDDLDGAKTALAMMLIVMTAECSAGYSDRVIITLHEDNSIEIEDFGRGMYLGSMPSSGWKEIFCELFADSRNYPDLLSPGFSLFEKENPFLDRILVHYHNTPNFDSAFLCIKANSRLSITNIKSSIPQLELED